MPRAAPVHPVELISARIDNEITPGEARFLEAHLRLCTSCQQKEAELKGIASGLVGLRVASPKAGAIDRLLTKLREANEIVLPALADLTTPAAPAEVEAPPRQERRIPWVSLATAAATSAMILFFLLYDYDAPVDRAAATGTGSPSSETLAVPEMSDKDTQPPGEPSEPTEGLRSLSSPAPRTEPTRARRPVVASAPAPVPVPESASAATQPNPLPDMSPASVELPDTGPDETPGVFQPIYFKGNSKRLTREARQVVEGVAAFLRQHEDINLVIKGHTGDRRSLEKNLALGHKRAVAVARQLENLGIDGSRLRPVSYVERQSADSNDRVDFALKH